SRKTSRGDHTLPQFSNTHNEKVWSTIALRSTHVCNPPSRFSATLATHAYRKTHRLLESPFPDHFYSAPINIRSHTLYLPILSTLLQRIVKWYQSILVSHYQ